MKRILIAAVVLLALLPVQAFSGGTDNFETITVLTSAVNTFTAAQVYDRSKQNQYAKSAFCTVAVATINYTFDGTTPTTGSTGVGHKAIAGSWFVISGYGRIAGFQAIAESSTSTVSCTYSFDQ